jgi:ATP-binding cassette subfamily B protein
VDAAATKARADQKILWLLGVLAVQAFIAYWRVKGFTRSGEAALNDLRRDLFRHLMKLPVPFFQDQRSGSVSNRVSADLGTVRETLLNTLPQAARHSVVLVGSLIAVFFFSWKLSLVMLASIPVVVLSIAMITLLVWSVIEAPKFGWTSLATIGGFVGAAALLAAFCLAATPESLA